jgi:hypothetical protein
MISEDHTRKQQRIVDTVSVQKKAYPGGAEYYYIVHVGGDRVGIVHKLWSKTQQPRPIGWGGKKETEPVRVFEGCRTMRDAIATLVGLTKSNLDK